MPKSPVRLFQVLLLALVLFAPAAHTQAQQASKWAQVLSGQARLVRGIMQSDGSIEAGVHIQLEDGWKTYWRVPGDAGVPPDFNWAGSVNVSGIEVLWPAPVWLHDAFGVSIGYKKEVVFPIVVKPADWTKASTVKLTLNFAVCKDICAPVQADLVLDLPTQSIIPQYAGLIARYMTRVPKPVDQVDGLRVTAVRMETADKDVFLIVDVSDDGTSPTTDVFVDGPEEFYFTVPKEEASGSDGQKRYRIRVDGATDATVLNNADVNFVLVQGDNRVAQSWRLQ